MVKKITTSLVLAAILGAFCAGCGSGTNSSSGTVNNTQQPGAENQGTGQPGTKGGSMTAPQPDR